jgi:hypothetical protein
VIEEFRSGVTKTRKDGSRGALRIDYGDPRKPEKPIQWLWKFIGAARTPGELYGRALVVIAAEQHASRVVVPSSQQHSPIRWSSRNDHARKALAKLVGPHLPVSLKQLEKAIAKAHAEHEVAISRHRDGARHARADVVGETEMEPLADAGSLEDDGIPIDECHDGMWDEDAEVQMRDLEDDLVEAAGVEGPDGAAYSDADPGL